MVVGFLQFHNGTTHGPSGKVAEIVPSGFLYRNCEARAYNVEVH